MQYYNYTIYHKWLIAITEQMRPIGSRCFYKHSQDYGKYKELYYFTIVALSKHLRRLDH